MTLKIFKALACAGMLMTSASAFAAPTTAPITVRAKADSTVMLMGDRVHINVEVLKNTHDGVLLTMPPEKTDYFGLEKIACVIDSADLGNDRVQLNYHFTFQAFTPTELLTLPPFVYTADGDTVASDPLTFKVLPVELSPELGDPEDIENLTIHPDELTQAVPLRWYDYIPGWSIWVLLGLAVVALAVALWLLYKKNGPQLFVPRKPIPPYEMAINNLRKLKGKQLIERGLAKQFFTEVTDIWRTYLFGRFGIQAMEMTSRQILRNLRDNEETRFSTQTMEEILQISDFVKFAALAPSPEDMHKAYNEIYNFVEKTRPLPEPEEADNKKNKQK